MKSAPPHRIPLSSPDIQAEDVELVTRDTNKPYQDQILPAVQEAIAKIEDPTGYYKIKNSVTVSETGLFFHVHV